MLNIINICRQVFFISYCNRDKGKTSCVVLPQTRKTNVLWHWYFYCLFRSSPFSFVCNFFFLLFVFYILQHSGKWGFPLNGDDLTREWSYVKRGSSSRTFWICEENDGLSERVNSQWLISAKGDLLPKLSCTCWRWRDFSRGWFRTGA